MHATSVEVTVRTVVCRHDVRRISAHIQGVQGSGAHGMRETAASAFLRRGGSRVPASI